MHWTFIDRNTIREKNSGYIVELISGTWANPREIKPITPKHAEFLRQAKLLRLGLKFAYDNTEETTSA